VRAVPELAGREDAEPEAARSDAPQGDDAKGGDARVAVARPALDPRRPESIIKPSEREIRSRLDELQGQKAAVEGKRAAEQGERSAEVQNVIAQLKARDGEVRAHEEAHMAAGGRYVTGGASYSYQKGPDGAEYAVGGEVGIDTSSVPGRPEETVQKMRTIRAAALAPSEPSAADLSVAAAAAEIEAAALAEIAQARSAEIAGQAGAGQAAARYGKEASAPSARGALALRYDAEPPRSPLDMVA
jgi:hypothetical protein